MLPLVVATNGESLASSVESALKRDADLPFFYFGHGRKKPPALTGRHGAVVLDHKSWRLMRKRLVCATACYSAELFGKEPLKHGISVLGYRGELMIILAEPGITKMRAAALAGPLAIIDGDALRTAKEKATAAYDRLADELYDSGDFNDVVLAPFVKQNARGVTLAGDGKRKLAIRL
jgi:hypothetical protein